MQKFGKYGLWAIPPIFMALWGDFLSDRAYLIALSLQTHLPIPFSPPILLLLLRLLAGLGWGVAVWQMVTLAQKHDAERAAWAIIPALICLPYLVGSVGLPDGWGLAALIWGSYQSRFGKRALGIFIFMLLMNTAGQLSILWGVALLVLLALFLLMIWLGRVAKKEQAAVWVLAGVAALIIVWPVMEVVKKVRSRPSQLNQAEISAGHYLHTQAPAGATLIASPHLAAHAALPTQTLPAAIQPDEQLAFLLENNADYLIADDTLSWQLLRRQPWMTANYQPIQRFDGTLTLYQKISRPVNGQAHPVQIDTPFGVRLVEATFTDAPIQPNQKISVALTWQATAAVPAVFNTVVRLVDPVSGAAFAQAEIITPHTLPPDWWDVGEMVQEVVEIEVSAETPIGAYILDIAVRDPNQPQLQPLTLADGAQTERAPLGHLPLAGNIALPADAQPINATFGDQITLVAYTHSTSGDNQTLTLYWQASTPPSADYTVFIHLINSGDGNFVTGFDSPPAGGHFPTRAWTTPFLIADRHTFSAPIADHSLQIGLYLPADGSRLPLPDGQTTLTLP